MLPFSLGDEFTNAIQSSLPSGELLRAVTEGFFCSFEYKYSEFAKKVIRQDFVTGTSTVAITNVSVRLVGFKTAMVLSPSQEKKKKDFLAKGLSEEKAEKRAVGLLGQRVPVRIPEVGTTTSYQIADVTSINYEEYAPARFVQQWAVEYLGLGTNERAIIQTRFDKIKAEKRIVEIGTLTFTCNNETVVINSLYNNLVDIHRNLEAAKSGAAIASSIINVEASLTRLKELLNDGVITSTEFEQAKSAFVGKAADVPESIASTLRQLNSLFADGILNEAEYRAKKFEVLARMQN